ncbi:hypothetical protein MBH78_01600 [Oceanimonas sp. NS1]|nr:hypothetical protein [Oceanimonas sp. NS1]
MLALPLVVKLLPGVALGFWLSRWLERRVHRDSVRPAILLISVLSALGVLWQGIRAGLVG